MKTRWIHHIRNKQKLVNSQRTKHLPGDYDPQTPVFWYTNVGGTWLIAGDYANSFPNGSARMVNNSQVPHDPPGYFTAQFFVEAQPEPVPFFDAQICCLCRSGIPAERTASGSWICRAGT